MIVYLFIILLTIGFIMLYDAREIVKRFLKDCDENKITLIIKIIGIIFIILSSFNIYIINKIY